MEALKLSIELVPKPLWGRSLYHLSPQWERLSKEVLERDDHCCKVCGGGDRIECHEQWAYDDVNHVQRLTGLITLCSTCHLCKHLGRAGGLASEGKLKPQEIIDHFLRVNGISMEEFLPLYRAARKQWWERSKHTWTQDFGEYSGLVPHEADRQTVVQAQLFDQE